MVNTELWVVEEKMMTRFVQVKIFTLDRSILRSILCLLPYFIALGGVGGDDEERGQFSRRSVQIKLQ